MEEERRVVIELWELVEVVMEGIVFEIRWVVEVTSSSSLEWGEPMKHLEVLQWLPISDIGLRNGQLQKQTHLMNDNEPQMTKILSELQNNQSK